MGQAVHRVVSDLHTEYFERSGMEARFWRGEIERSLHVLAKPDIGQERGRRIFLRTDVAVEPSPWFGHWWAKILRRYDSWVRRTMPYGLERILRLPHWLVELIWAKFVRYSCYSEQLPDDVLERIQTMRHYLVHQGYEPTKIVVGRKGLPRHEGYAEYYPESFDRNGMEYVFGLPVQINPFIGDDEVLVV